MISMFIHELKQYRKSTIIWCISLIVGAAMYLSIYPSVAKEFAQVKQVIQNFPEALKKAFDISVVSYASINGFYKLILNMIILAGAIQAMNIGTGIVSKEERDNTAEFLLAKPVSRSTVLTSKLAAALTLLVLTNIVYILSVPYLANAIANATIDYKTYLLMTLTLFFVQLFFLALGFFVSVVTPKIRSVLSVSLSTVFAFYIIGILDTVLGKNRVRYLTPFKFYDLDYVIKHSSYEIRFVIFEAVVVIAAVAASYYLYSRRDIKTL